jgi:hypothetical protein
MIEDRQLELFSEVKPKIKIAGMYQYKDGSNCWLMIQKKIKGDIYLVYDFMLDDEDYDCEICEMSSEEIEKVADLSKCYSGKFRNGILWAVWDGGNKETLRVVYDVDKCIKV